MTFNAGKPSSGESPALFPAENQANMSRLQTMFSEDHQFNTTAASNDGWHKILHWVQQSGLIDPLNPSAAAPNNTGGPPIAWEQLDAYSVARPWFRDANAGNVISMGAFNEIRGTIALTTTAVVVVTPPANTFGMIYLWNPATGVAGFGYYIMDTADTANLIAFSASQPNVTPVVIAGTTIATPLTGKIYAATTSGTFDATYDYRVLYRYI